MVADFENQQSESVISTQAFPSRDPGYPSFNILLATVASDGLDRDQIHRATMRAACSAILNKRTDHWLCVSRTVEPRAATDVNGLLSAYDYFLHVSGADAGTAVVCPAVPGLRSWQFPHDSLPDLWNEALGTDNQFGADGGS